MSKEVHSFITISALLEEVFSYFFSLNPTVILQGIWLVPKAENYTLKNKGAKPGSEQLIYFEDGSTALYQLFSLVPQVSFSVHIDDFRSKRFRGLEAMRCHFTFLQLESGKVIVACRYQFQMSSRCQLLFDLFLQDIIQKKLDSDLVLGAKKLYSLVK